MDAHTPQETAALSIDLPGFAWEFLRRRPAYRCDYHASAEKFEASEPTKRRFQERWGIVFPARP